MTVNKYHTGPSTLQRVKRQARYVQTMLIYPCLPDEHLFYVLIYDLSWQRKLFDLITQVQPIL